MKQHKTPLWKKLLFQELPLIIVMHVIMLSFVLSVFAASKANAFEVRDKPTVFLDFNIASKHSQDHYYVEEPVYYQAHPMYDHLPDTHMVKYQFNEDNAGLGIRYQVHENIDISLGFYDNSYHKTSVYVGAEAHTSRKRLISIGIALATVSGYSDTPTETPLLLLPVVQIGPPQIGARIGYIPFGEIKFTTFQMYLGF